MTERIIPIVPSNNPRSLLRVPEPIEPNGFPIRDTLTRPLKDLRISVTDRCNFRCRYCMPREVFDKQYTYLPHSDLITFEEIARLAKLFVNLGVNKIRLTGGEPLLRKDLQELIALLCELKTPQGQALDLTLTTNGALLARKAQLLKNCGLKRVTVSLDAIDDDLFRSINDADFSVASVLEGIKEAKTQGLWPIKINMVVQRGVNDHQILPMARHFYGSGLQLRFIEFMDVGATNGWSAEQVVASQDLIGMLKQEFDLIGLGRREPSETCERWAFANALGQADSALGEVGVISSVTQPFCSHCSRARLSTDGRLFMCLFADAGFDLRALLRSGASDESITQTIAAIWQSRGDRYSELRSQDCLAAKDSHSRRIEMSFIGG